MALSLFVHLLRVTSTNLTTAGQLDKQTSRPAGLTGQELKLSRLSSVGIGLHCNTTIVSV